MKKLIGLLLTLVMVIGLSSTAFAYETTGWEIDSTLTFVPYEGFGSTSITHMENAADKWNDRVDDLTLLSISSDTHSEDSGYYDDDDNNYIYREDVGAGYVAEAATWTSSSEVTQCDININVYYAWANSAQSGCYDVYSVILHEFGHPVGLEDLDDEDEYSYDTAVMWYAAHTNATKRSLKTDDINGVEAIYE